MRSLLFSSRSLKVETSPQQQPTALSGRSPAAALKSPGNNATTPRFMTSTASSISKTTNRLSYTPDPSTSDHLDTSEKLMQDLIRFTRSSDRRMLIRTLKDCTLLQNIPVEESIFNADYPMTTEAWNELKQDVASNIPIELNGALMGAASSNDTEKRQEGEKLLHLLPLLCNKLVQGVTMDENSAQRRITSDELHQILLLRLSQKRNSAITFAQLNKVLGSKDLALQVPKRPIKPLQHSNLVVYISDNAIHAVMEHQYAIGLFRKSDSAGRPWIGLTASIRERINLSKSTTPNTHPAAVRYITLQIHEEKAVVY